MKKLIRFALNHLPRTFIQRFVHVVTPVMGLFYMGRGVECPVCGRRYRKFLPYGYGPSRDNALCPSCLSLERHRMIWLWLTRETGFLETRPAKTLHIAPELCFIKRLRKALGTNYVTADLESPLADVKMDVQQIPFADGSFGVVICNHILEHVTDDRLAMREVFRVMAAGGWGIMNSPVNYDRDVTYEDPSITLPEERHKAFGQKDHLRDYGRDYPARLREAGFEVEEIDYLAMLGPEMSSLYGLRPEIIYLVRKPAVI